MLAKIRETLEKRNTLIQAGRDLYKKVEAEKRSMTAEERASDDARLTEIDDLRNQITRMERQQELEREQAAAAVSSGNTPPAGSREGDTSDREHRSRLISHAERLSRFASVSGEGASRSVTFEDRGLEARASLAYHRNHEAYLRGEIGMKELRALAADVSVTGGYLVMPLQMTMDLIQAVDDLVFIRKFATKHLVTNADGIGMPSLDADPADADWTAEIATGSDDSSMQFGRRELKPYPLAKRIKVSNKLLRASAMNVENLVRQRLSYKFGVTEEKAFLTGHGAGQPLGVFTASNDGIPTSRDVATGSATGFTFDGIYDAKYALKGAYWNRPSTSWGFHRDALKLIAKLKDSQNRYLWEPSQQVGQPDRLIGTPLYMSEFFPNTFTTGLYVGMLADWSYYHIADALGMSVQRLGELYAETNQIGFIGRMELDGMPVLGEAFVRIKTS
jgi:HK97 family phage major capsid protein